MKFSKIALIALASGLFASSAMAADDTTTGAVTVNGGTVKFIGSVVDGACSIVPESVNQVVDLGSISKKTLLDGGQSTAKEFTIQLEDCVLDTTDGAANTVSVTFQGASVDNSSDLLAVAQNSAVEGGSGFGLQLIDANSNKIKIGEATSVVQSLKEGDNTLSFKVYAQGVNDNINVGPFSSTANFLLTYQ